MTRTIINLSVLAFLVLLHSQKEAISATTSHSDVSPEYTYTYFTQDKNITQLNTQLPAKKGLLKKKGIGVLNTGNYQNITTAPKTHLEIETVIRLGTNEWHVSGYNKVVNLEQAAEKAWALIELALQRRLDLVSNIVNTVKGYAEHEKELFENIAKSREKYFQAVSREGKIEASNQLTGFIDRLLLLQERYPDLKTNQNFIDNQVRIEGTENRINSSRTRYNEAAKLLNSYARQSFGKYFISVSYILSPHRQQLNSRIPIYQQVFSEDAVNTHVYLIFPKEVILTKEVQLIDTINNGTGRGARMATCSPENTKLSGILRKYNAVIEGTYELSESDKSEMERAFDNTTDYLGKVGLGISVVKGVIKKALEEDEKRRIKRLQEKYRDYHIHKIPFHAPEGISLAYTYIGRTSTIYFDALSLTKPGRVFIEIPKMTFGLTAFGASRRASLEGLVYELGLTTQIKQEEMPLWETKRDTREIRVEF